MGLVQLDVAFVGRSTWTAIIVDDFLELTREVHLFRRLRGRVSVLDRMHVIPSMDMLSVFDDLVMIYGSRCFEFSFVRNVTLGKRSVLVE